MTDEPSSADARHSLPTDRLICGERRVLCKRPTFWYAAATKSSSWVRLLKCRVTGYWRAGTCTRGGATGKRRLLAVKSSMRRVALMISSFRGCTEEWGSLHMLRRKGTTRDSRPASTAAPHVYMYCDMMMMMYMACNACDDVCGVMCMKMCMACDVHEDVSGMCVS